MNQQFIRRPTGAIYLESLLLSLFCGLASLVSPRVSPLNRLGVTAGLSFLVFLIGVSSFLAFGVWVKTVYIVLALGTILATYTIRDIIIRQKSLDRRSKESIETNRMLGLSFQSQGLLDLAFEKFRKCPLDDAMKDVIYNLGLDYERKRMTNKAIAVYEYIIRKEGGFRDLDERIPKLKEMIGPLALGSYEGKKDDKIALSDDLETKPTVGRYEVLQELGQGAMGVVYKARDPRINRLLAIKTIRFSDEFEAEKLKEVKDRFLREAEIAGRLSHPAIVAIYDMGEDYDLTYLAMELLEGEDLQEHCRQGSLLPLKRVLHVVAATATALDYAHSQGVIHRDVKPGNIMLLTNRTVKVTDFGIAKAMSDSKTKSGIILGTPNYMSPEQINGQEIDGRSDVFSLGVVFYELLTGALPFHGKTLTNLFYQITQEEPRPIREINPRIPKPVAQIVDKALSKAPDRRFQRAGDLARYVRAVLQKMEELQAQARK
jgi:serine/threonine-protein kinase